MHIETGSMLFDELDSLCNQVTKLNDRRMAMAIRDCVRRIKI